MQFVLARQALIGEEWQRDVAVEIGSDGRIRDISGMAGVPPGQEVLSVDLLLPAPVNLHSHAFQRAMAGMTERRGPVDADTFWTWRQQMFRFLEALTPPDVEAIAAFVQLEMLEAGFAAVAEFHYLHHQPDGTPYDNPAEMSERILAAARTSGIGLTLLPALYQQGGCNGAPLREGQKRFGNDVATFCKLVDHAQRSILTLPDDSNMGVAPHSLRAVSPEGLQACVQMAAAYPIHMHLAEQAAEVEEVQAAYGRRPAEWLLEHQPPGPAWCLIHATHLTAGETRDLARSGAVAGLCPITESSLGDGIFNGVEWASHAGRYGIGSDSNIRISLAEELRTLEYSQRLRHQRRAIMACPPQTTGGTLFRQVAAGGAAAAGRNSGRIAPGCWADLLALDMSRVNLAGKEGDAILDSYIFAGDDRMVQHVWSAGRHLVQKGRHVRRREIDAAYRKTIARIRENL